MEIDNFLPGSASLVEMIDKRLLVSLRDGRHLYGYLRAYDQFANLVLQDCIERIFVMETREMAQVDHGIFLVRGENVVLVGEISEHVLSNGRELMEQEEEERTDEPAEASLPLPDGWVLVSQEHAQTLQKQSRAIQKENQAKADRILRASGFSIEQVEGDAY
ncbi:SM-like, degradation of cytoplasmic mRNAs and positively regulates transcription initiation [Kappamyces sp. JEL0829]|nr:SM-like, degradation of cytoplasmic mRNAs and positively regulates transcription initiation [Kappamyces sp. JEL0829]KAJ3370569.1 SM-like, degradation of cytoplasmic mRNAs and positively regulates transcription initiation [Kappamyces sp. JEL0680]